MPPLKIPSPALYAVTPGPRDDLLSACAAVLRGGATILQYRDKTSDSARREREAKALAALCRVHTALFIVNDDIELALRCAADGVHLGQSDAGLEQARKRLGAERIIGMSCYDSLDRARQLAAAGADYLAFGAFYNSPTKPAATRANPDVLRAAKAIGLPLVAIGGITIDNAPALLDAGADCLAVVSGVFAAANPEAAARAFQNIFFRQQESH